VRLLTWHNGKITRTQIMEAQTISPGDEITFTLREEKGPAPQHTLPVKEAAAEGEGLYRAIVAVKGSSSSAWFKVPKLKGAWEGGPTVRCLYPSTPAELKDGQDFSFWAAFGGTGSNLFE